MKAMAYLGMPGKLAKPGHPAWAACSERARYAMLAVMEPPGTARLALAAEEKLAKALPLSRDEQLALLARLLARQETRKERRYAGP